MVQNFISNAKIHIWMPEKKFKDGKTICELVLVWKAGISPYVIAK